MYPGMGYTKIDIVQYYNRISEYILPFMKDRPLTLQRFPDGVDNDGFYQKNAADYFPDFIERVRIETRDGTKTQIICNSKKSLIYLINQGTLTFHIWLSKASHLNKPDKVVFDLDPPEGAFLKVKKAARIIEKFLKKQNLSPEIMLTGKSGIHLWYNVKPEMTFDDRREQVKNYVYELEHKHPELFTTEMRIAERNDKIFVDYLRNAYGQTSVCPYSLRPSSHPTVATPISANILQRTKKADKYDLGNIFRRLAQVNH